MKESEQQSERRRRRLPTNIQSLEFDILCIIFTFLDIYDLIRCSVVCKSWNSIIHGSRLLHAHYLKQIDFDAASNLSIDLGRPLTMLLKDMAMDHHRLALARGTVHADQWTGHTTGIAQCRMKMGMILTGVGDKVIRLWSVESYKCLEEYSLSDVAPLVDFDFDESKVVGLIGTRLCIVRRHGNRSIFPTREGTFTKGLCMRYIDPEAVVGCEDGTVRVFDMYSRCCSQIIRMHSCPITSIAMGENQLIVSGSSVGSVTLSDLSSDGGAAMLKSPDRTGIKTLCYNPSSQMVFAGSTSGYAACWDLRKMQSLWEARLSPNVLYSMHHLLNDTSTLVVGGIDGVLRIVDQHTGEVLSRCVMVEGNPKPTSVRSSYGSVERKKVKRLAEDASIGNIPTATRPPINCLAVGMKKVVTTHNTKYVRVWKFSKIV